MRYKFIKVFLIIVSLSVIFGINIFHDDFSGDVYAYQSYDSFEEFDKRFKELTKDDDLSTVFIDSTPSSSEVLNAINECLGYEIEMFSVGFDDSDDVELSEEELIDVCEYFNCVLYDNSDGYEIYNKYKAKRIIVFGEVNNSFGASEVLTLDDYNILFYETEVQTEFAYKSLIEDKSLIVVLDMLIKCDDAASVDTEYDYSGLQNAWGADAIDLGYYAEHLATNNHGEEVVVAVVDSGVQSTHELFEGRMLTNSSGNLVGYSFSYAVTGYFYRDGSGHGTHVAGTICELTPENVKILPVKVFGDSGSGYLTYVTEGLKSLTSSTYSKYNIVCANMSLGNKDPLSEEDLEDWDNAFSECFDGLRNNDILPIVSAGNEASDSASHVPATCDNAVTVGSVKGPLSSYKSGGTTYIQGSQIGYTGYYYFDTSYSNYGDDVDIVAPGTWILSANNENDSGYVYMKGTSMATPHVSAAVALLACDNLNKNISVDKIEKKLLNNCTTQEYKKNGASLDKCYGMLNLKYVLGNISYTLTDTVATYDGTSHNIKLTDIGASNYKILYRFETETEYSETTSDNSNYKNVTNGEKKVYFIISADGYKETSSYGYLTINKAPLTIKCNNQNHVYGNTVDLDDSEYTITSGNVYGGDFLGVTLSTGATNKSFAETTHDILGSATNENYDCTFIKGELTVVKRPIDITLLEQSSKYGDDIILDPTAYNVTSVYGVVNGDDLDLGLLTTATKNSPVGDYELYLNGYNSNYIITASNGIYKIEHKTVKITSNQTGCYGTSPNLDQSNYSTDVAVNRTKLALTMSTGVTSETVVGNYPILFSTSNSNFIISSDSVGTYYVFAKPITVSATNQNATYGDTTLIIQGKYNISADAIVNGDEVSFVLKTSATSKSGIGNYSIEVQCSGSDVNNYSITKLSGILTISKRPITITANNQTSMYGENVVLNSTKFTVANSVNGDTFNPTLSTSATKLSPIGDYDIKINCVSANYDITLVNGKLTITPRKITITVANQSMIYGEKLNLRNRYSVTSEDKIVNGDSLNIKLLTTATDSSPVGTYPITLTYSNNNYDIEIVEGTLTITSQTIRITLLDQECVYGDEIVLDNTKFTVNILDYNTENLGVEITTTAVQFSPIGSYSLSATCSNPNVSVVITDAKLIIKPRLLTIDIQNQTSIYGDIKFNLNLFTLGNVVNNDLVPILISTNATNASSVGSNYKITAKCYNNNYVLPEAQGVFTIEPRPITITLNNQSNGCYGAISFDKNDYTLSEQPVNGDLLNINISTTATNASVVGDYPITFTYNNDNYILKGDNALFTVNPRPIEIEIKQSSTYGDEVVLNPKLFIVTSTLKLVGSDDLKLTLSTTATSKSAPGTYDIEFENGNKNYAVTANVKRLTITRRRITVASESLTDEFVYGNDIVLDQTKYTISNLVNEDKIKVSLSTSADGSKPVGFYEITPLVEQDVTSDKYEITYVCGVLEIKPRKIAITIADQETYYGAQIDLKPLYEITSENKIVNGDNLNIVLKTNATNLSSIGDYDIWLEYNNGNYIVEITNGKLKIKQCDMIITIENQSGYYGNDIVLDQTKFSVNVEIDKRELGVTLKTTATKNSVVGDNYEIFLEYTNTNYDIVVEKGVFTVMPRPVTVNILNQTCEYGNIVLDNTKYVLSEQTGDLHITLTTTATSLDVSGSEHEISFTYENKNYILTASKPGKLTIVPRTVRIATYQTSYYGDVVQLDNEDYFISSGSVINDDDLELTMSCSVGGIMTVGQYEIEINYTNSNYNVVIGNAVLEVLPRKITISTVQEKRYGDDVELDNENYQINAGSLVNGDNLNLKLTTNVTKVDNVGDDYTITVLSSNPNYEVSVLSGKLIITKRRVVVSSKQTTIYGKVVLDEENYTIVEGEKAFESDDLDLSFSTDATDGSDVGEYELFVSTSNINYEVVKDDLSKVNIKARPLTLRLNPSQSVYGEEVVVNDAYLLTSGSIVNGDSLSFEFTTDANYLSNVGVYAIGCNCNNLNYEINLINNTHTITKRKITIELKDQSSPHGLLYDINQSKYDIVEGEVVNNSDLQVEIYSNGEQFSFMGKYDLMAKSNNSNYDVEVINAKLTLTPSVEDFSGVAVVIGIVIATIVAVVKHKKKKKKNQELFDKYIGW